MSSLRALAVLMVVASALAACSGQTLDAGATRAVTSRAPATARAVLSAMVDAVAMDDASLYFTCEDGFVYRLAKTGTEPPQPIAPITAPGSLEGPGIAVDDANVYFTALGDGVSGGAVMRVPKTGGAPVALAESQPRPRGIAVDGANVYWALQGAPPANNGGIGTGAIMMVSKANSPGAPLALASQLISPDSIALDGEGVLWHEYAALRRVAKTGGASSTLLSSPTAFRVSNLVVAAGRVYFSANLGTWSVGSVATAGGAPAMLASGLDQPAYVAVDASAAVFWSQADATPAGTILSLPGGGGSATPVVLEASPSDGGPPLQGKFLLVDPRALYAIDYQTIPTLTVTVQVLPIR